MSTREEINFKSLTEVYKAMFSGRVYRVASRVYKDPVRDCNFHRIGFHYGGGNSWKYETFYEEIND